MEQGLRALADQGAAPYFMMLLGSQAQQAYASCWAEGDYCEVQGSDEHEELFSWAE